ncbi:MAG: HIT family protein [Lentisphaerota bacterium]
MHIHFEKNCPYCSLIKPEGKKTHVIFRDELVTAFLFHMPVNIGHSIVIPNSHFLNPSSLSENVAGRMYCIASRIGVACKRSLNSDGFNILSCDGFCSGQDIQHAHIHLIPRYLNDGWNLNWRALEKPKLDETLRAILMKFKASEPQIQENKTELDK